MDQHHPKVGGEVGRKKVPLKRLIQEPDLGLGGADLQVDVTGLVQSRPLRLGREHEADLARSVTSVQLKYLPSQSKLRMEIFGRGTSIILNVKNQNINLIQPGITDNESC